MYANITPAKCVSPQENSIKEILVAILDVPVQVYIFAPPTEEMTHMDAHNAEYLAAVAAMPEHTISPPRCLDEHAVGDHLAFRLKGWGDRTYDDGRVVDINEERHRLLVETATDIVEVDPRPWPVGEVLPF